MDGQTMTQAVCPHCGGHVVHRYHQPKKYICQLCFQDSNIEDLKLIPVIRGQRKSNEDNNEFVNKQLQEVS